MWETEYLITLHKAGRSILEATLFLHNLSGHFLRLENCKQAIASLCGLNEWCGLGPPQRIDAMTLHQPTTTFQCYSDGFPVTCCTFKNEVLIMPWGKGQGRGGVFFPSLIWVHGNSYLKRLGWGECFCYFNLLSSLYKSWKKDYNLELISPT